MVTRWHGNRLVVVNGYTEALPRIYSTIHSGDHVMDAREAREWLMRARGRDEAYNNPENIKANNRFLERRAQEQQAHVCTLPVGAFTGYRWYAEGKMIYITPIINRNEAS